MFSQSSNAIGFALAASSLRNWLHFSMGRIHVLPEHVANKIAAGEVVERPASVVKELLENSLDAGARRIEIQIEAGGKKLIQVTDDGCGMVRDDALLAFERHATSKIRTSEDLLRISSLGFRGEALPSIASVSRLRLETQAGNEASGTRVEIHGGKIVRVEEAGLPLGTSLVVRDLFFNTPARKKFLKSEATELAHVASLVTHYALANPDKHFELHSTTNALLIAPPVATHRERVYQIFGKDTLDQLIPVSAELPLPRGALAPPWLSRHDEDAPDSEPGRLRLDGFVSKPEIQKLNRNSLYTFVNRRLIRDRVVQHALADAYRNILPPGVFPVVLLFLEMPQGEVDVNVHPSKAEVRFRQQTAVHDFVRDRVRAELGKARPVPEFLAEIIARPSHAAALSPELTQPVAEARASTAGGILFPGASPQPILSGRFDFPETIVVERDAAPLKAGLPLAAPVAGSGTLDSAPAIAHLARTGETYEAGAMLASLKPLGQLRSSFILAVNADGLWIIDQHVAHERILFEKVVRERGTVQVERQRLLMPIVAELTPAQQAVFDEISAELAQNGFEAEPFGSRSIAVKAAPAGVPANDVEQMLQELLEQFAREEQQLNLEQVRARIAASIACHAAIKVNMPLEQAKMEWLIRELGKTRYPMSCPHGRPVVLRYSIEDIERAFKRI
jgi:DNA mismatch repair protein MutL